MGKRKRRREAAGRIPRTPEMVEMVRLGNAVRQAEERRDAACAFKIVDLGGGNARVSVGAEVGLEDVLDALTAAEQAAVCWRVWSAYVDEVGVGVLCDAVRRVTPELAAAGFDDAQMAKTVANVGRDCENHVVLLSSLANHLREGGVAVEDAS